MGKGKKLQDEDRKNGQTKKGNWKENWKYIREEHVHSRIRREYYTKKAREWKEHSIRMHEENGNLRTGMADDTKKAGRWMENGIWNTRKMKENNKKGKVSTSHVWW